MEVINLCARPEVILRVAMTLQAPLHVEGLGPPGERHLVDRYVSGGTAHAFVDVDAVVEKNEVGQVVDPVPRQRPASR